MEEGVDLVAIEVVVEVLGAVAVSVIEVVVVLAIEVVVVGSGVVVVSVIEVVAVEIEVVVVEEGLTIEDHGLETITREVNRTDLESHGVTKMEKGVVVGEDSEAAEAVLREINLLIARPHKTKKLRLTIDDKNMYKGEGVKLA